MRPRKTPNPKRRVRARPATPEDLQKLKSLAQSVSYGGNPEHKRNPGDFGLDPPSTARQAKSLCDEVNIFSRAEALALLKKGMIQGLVSVQERSGWPQNVWAVTSTGVPVEAMLENRNQGTYHGFPMQPGDPLADQIIRLWSNE